MRFTLKNESKSLYRLAASATISQKAKGQPGSSLTLLPRLGYLVFSRLVPVRAFAARTELWFILTIRIAGNPLILTASAPEAPNSNFHFRHDHEYSV
ncbi:MAG: hypothetical protein DMF72_12050 [Acidobacteria bacterium]|nr:MAG: hypothetical protein DMF72_12050 [Acidobacteriota bacterium]